MRNPSNAVAVSKLGQPVTLNHQGGQYTSTELSHTDRGPRSGYIADMSTALVIKELQRFLSSDEPEVICLRGHWGVGKTYTWNKYLKEASLQANIALERYLYVSLFGVNSLDEFRYSIFENIVRCSQVDAKPSLETVRTNLSAGTEQLARRFTWLVQRLSIVNPRRRVGTAMVSIGKEDDYSR